MADYARSWLEKGWINAGVGEKGVRLRTVGCMLGWTEKGLGLTKVGSINGYIGLSLINGRVDKRLDNLKGG